MVVSTSEVFLRSVCGGQLAGSRWSVISLSSEDELAKFFELASSSPALSLTNAAGCGFLHRVRRVLVASSADFCGAEARLMKKHLELWLVSQQRLPLACWTPSLCLLPKGPSQPFCPPSAWLSRALSSESRHHSHTYNTGWCVLGSSSPL